ncbi:MAG: hypothetical protein K2G23_00720 [Muribaculaceae bacterium]|nr:hypothetical protein [Muribaculaceae bacterium]
MKNSLLSAILVSILGILGCACNDNSSAPSEVSVDKDIVVAIYSTSDKDGGVDTISPCLMKETVHISELLHYPNDEGITMPFNLSDTIKWAEITESKLDKRIAISVNGEVLSTPVVKMKLTNGACSVVLNDAQMAAFFPDVNIKELQSTNN